MIGLHPGGLLLTEELFSLAGILPPARILDLGAGEGETVRYLRGRGFEALGIDRRPRGEDVTGQDMEALAFPDGSFDVCLAECSISGCRDGMAALKEACRILRPGGSLLISDVFFHREEAPRMSMEKPLVMPCWEDVFRKAGFTVLGVADKTALWREFFLESLWNGNADECSCGFFREAGRAGCGYFLAWLQKI